MTPDIERAAKAIKAKTPVDYGMRLTEAQDYAIAALETLAESEAFVEAAASGIARLSLLQSGLDPNNLPQFPGECSARECEIWRKAACTALRAGLAAVLGRKP